MTTILRSYERTPSQMRPVTLTPAVSRHAEGSCMVEFGGTKVLCTASVEDRTPSFLRGSGSGWVTAEYSMLPRSTSTRNGREAARGKQSGRTQEIQRLIGRSLRSVCDLKALGERQIIIDCDVIEADGGTRTASITGGYVALHLACQTLLDGKEIAEIPLKQPVAAISCGVCEGVPLLDLDYIEDSSAEVDANFIYAGNGNVIEIQGTAEGEPFAEEVFLSLMKLAREGTAELFAKQKEILGIA